MQRRSILLAGLFNVSVARIGTAAPAATALRVGADFALIDSGLSAALQRAFTLDTGIALSPVPGPALALLDALAAGELDAALLNIPGAEGLRERDGLVHDRLPIANGNFVLVGPPSMAGRGGPARSSAVSVLTRLAQASAGSTGIAFVSANDGSGGHVAEQALWRLAGIAPQAPWYRPARQPGAWIAEARRARAHAVVERGAWAALGGAPLAIVGAGDPVLVEQVHVMRSFRSPHPAGKLFVRWIAGPRGRAIVSARPGYRATGA